MSLRLVHDAEPPKALGPAPEDAKPSTPSASAPKAPAPAKRALPLELARGLKAGEPVVWWGEKTQIRWTAVLIASASAFLMLALVTLLVPEFWAQPWRDWSKAVGATQLPALLILVREYKGRRKVAVTDTAVLDLDPGGSLDRIGFRTIRAVKRDWFSGGVRLIGQRHEVRIPPALMEDAREAIASQTRHILDFGSERPDDRLAWFPWTGS